MHSKMTFFARHLTNGNSSRQNENKLELKIQYNTDVVCEPSYITSYYKNSLVNVFVGLCVCVWVAGVVRAAGRLRSKGRYCGLGDKTAIELSEKRNWLLSPFLRARYASKYEN